MPRKTEREVDLVISGKDRSAKAIEGAVRRLDKMEVQARKTTRLFNRLGTAIAVALPAGLFLQQTREIARAGLELERWRDALRAATGSAAAGAKELVFLRTEAERLGLDLASLVQGFTKLTAASRGTILEGRKTRDIFRAVAEASTAIRLTSEQTEGALRAIEQIMSKGKVQAEELRGQLGERLPGAFQIASRAMGVTTAELSKMLETGQVLSEDFLPKFAKELTKTFGEAAVKNANSAQAAFNRLGNSIRNLRGALAESGILENLTDAARTLDKMLRLVGRVRAVAGASVAETAGKSVQELTELRDEIDKATREFEPVIGQDNDERLRNLVLSRRKIVNAILALRKAEVDASQRLGGGTDLISGLTGASDAPRPPTRPKPRPELTKQEIREAKALARADRELLQSLTPLHSAYAKYFDRVDDVNDLLARNKLTTEDHTAALKDAGKQLAELLTVQETFKPIKLEEAIPFEDFLQKLRDANPEIVRLEQTIADMAGTATSAFEDAIVRMEDFGDIARALSQDLLRLFIRQNVSPGINDFFSGIFKSLVGHTGGVVGTLQGRRSVSPLAFAGAPRFHSGGLVGLARNEVPVIAERGEEILTQADPRHRANGGGGPSVVQNIEIDARGADMGVEQRIRVAMNEAEDRAVTRIVREAGQGGAVARALGRRR